MREVITIHTGQAGVQISHAVWELACLEHGLTKNGELMTMEPAKEDVIGEGIDMMFNQCRRGNYTPRAMLIDLEPSVIDEVRIGTYRQLWSPFSMISGKEDAASNYARAFYSQARHYIDIIMDRMRCLVEQSESLSCFKMIYSANGGTGSGLTTALCEELSSSYGKKFKFATSIYPSPNYSDATVEPYNAVLHTAATLEMCDCVTLADNQAIHGAIMSNIKEEHAGFTLLNRIIARIINAQFLAHRYYFMGQQKADVSELLINLVPYPRIHFPIMAFTPFVGRSMKYFEKITANQLLDRAFEEKNQLASITTSSQPYISCAILFRGAVAPIEAIGSIQHIKAESRAHFVDWCPTGFKLGINFSPPIKIPEDGAIAIDKSSLSMIAGNLGVKDVWYTTKHHFDLLYSKRAFVHWYVGEGMEEGEFTDGVDTIESLIKEYEDIGREIDGGDEGSLEEQSEQKPVPLKLSKTLPKSRTSDKAASKPKSSQGHNINVNASDFQLSDVFSSSKLTREKINSENQEYSVAARVDSHEYFNNNRSNSLKVTKGATIVKPKTRQSRRIITQVGENALASEPKFTPSRSLINSENYCAPPVQDTNWSAAARIHSEISLNESYQKVMYPCDQSSSAQSSDKLDEKCCHWVLRNHEEMMRDARRSPTYAESKDSGSLCLSQSEDHIYDFCLNDCSSEISASRTVTPKPHFSMVSTAAINPPESASRLNFGAYPNTSQSHDNGWPPVLNSNYPFAQNVSRDLPPIPKRRNTSSNCAPTHPNLQNNCCTSRRTVTEASIDDPSEMYKKEFGSCSDVCIVLSDDLQIVPENNEDQFLFADTNATSQPYTLDLISQGDVKSTNLNASHHYRSPSATNLSQNIAQEYERNGVASRISCRSTACTSNLKAVPWGDTRRRCVSIDRGIQQTTSTNICIDLQPHLISFEN